MSVRYKQVDTNDWNINNNYSIGTCVKYDGNYYVALKDVTKGVNIGMSDYWKKITIDSDIDGLKEDIDGLKEDIDALNYNNFGTAIDITAYDSASNVYNIPKDGYIYANARNNTSGYIRIYLAGNTSAGYIGASINVTEVQQMLIIYVKKGMRCYVSTELSEIIVDFIPFVK